MYDLLITNASIVDGTGSPAYFGDIGISNGKIVRIGKDLGDAKKTIDATGLTVTPGFIDSHSHSDRAFLDFPEMIEKIEQGITTSIAGQCGESAAPINREITPEKATYFEGFGKATDVCRTMGTFLDIVKNVPMGSNNAMLVGHGALRMAVMGTENRAPTDDELEQMKELLRDGMEHGALGVSLGLIYIPSCYAKTDELIEIAKVVKEYHGIVTAHIRDESNTVIQAVHEFIEIIRASGARGVLSHHKATRIENWGKVSHSLRMIDEANREGLEIYSDVYPYVASSTTVSTSFMPKDKQSGGAERIVALLSDPKERKLIKDWAKARWGNDLSWMQIIVCKAYPEYEGLRVPEIARLRGSDQYDALYDMIADSENVCRAVYFTMCEEDVETVMVHPRVMICTDSSVAKNDPVFHPRLKGSFPRVLGRYVRERHVTSLPEMIRKMTAMPARVYGLKTKGLIWEGMDADLCIFDAEKIIDHSEFTNCNQRAEGLNYVILGGEVVAENAIYNGKKPGRLLLRNE